MSKESGGQIPAQNEPLNRETFVRPLLAWYDLNKRDLPWRDEPTPYHVWVSEIMLQQTRIETVRSYYQRFISFLPDIQALASCEDDLLMKLWEGLGYYSRARNMKKAAQQICSLYNGRMPADYELLLKLPGIGPYTAGAIASIAFNIPVAAVDGNVLRVMARVTDNEGDVLRTSVKKEISGQVAALVPPGAPGKFTQAMMELGEVICTPGESARCGQCPVRTHCLALARGKVSVRPVRLPKHSKKTVYLTILVITDGWNVLVRKRPDQGLLAGLYELPHLDGSASGQEALRAVRKWLPGAMEIHGAEPLPQAHHIFTHLRWEMTGYKIITDRLDIEQIRMDGLMAVPIHLLEEKYALPSAFAAYTEPLKRQIHVLQGADRSENSV